MAGLAEEGPNGPAQTNGAVRRFLVLRGAHGGWLIYREGESKPLQNLRLRLNAFATAKMMARQHTPSEVLLEDDGQYIVWRPGMDDGRG